MYWNKLSDISWGTVDTVSGMFVDNNIDDFNVIKNIYRYGNCYALPSVGEFYRTVYSSHVMRFLS